MEPKDVGDYLIGFFTVLALLWLTVRWLASNFGAKGLEARMRRMEERHRQGMVRNIELAQREGWTQVVDQVRPVDPTNPFVIVLNVLRWIAILAAITFILGILVWTVLLAR